jgi:formyl-CoA transferase
MIADWTKRHTKYEAMEIIGAAGVPAGAVLDTMELYNDKTFEQRGIMQTVQHPANGAFKMAAWPVRFSGNPPPVKPAPLLGEHTGDVLNHWLNLDDAAVGNLRNSGVVG